MEALLARDMGGAAVPLGAEAGLHLSVGLHGLDDREVSRRALALGVDAPPLASFRLEPRGEGGLVLGFAALPPERLRASVKVLAQAASRPARR